MSDALIEPRQPVNMGVAATTSRRLGDAACSTLQRDDKSSAWGFDATGRLEACPTEWVSLVEAGGIADNGGRPTTSCQADHAASKACHERRNTSRPVARTPG
jgi:hypothetical protein